MNVARIAELLEPFLGPARDRPLTTTDLEHISTYIDLLLRWNSRVNLTAVRDPDHIVTRHFGESIFAARHVFPRGRAALQGRVQDVEKLRASPDERADPQRPTGIARVKLADLGSGAGFPGIPIKLWAPQISVTLVESNHKKVAFLREVARALTLTGIDIVAARAESFAGPAFDVVTLRAVERFESILPVAARLVAPGGRLALLISTLQLERVRASLPRLSWTAPIPVPLSRNRILALATFSG